MIFLCCDLDRSGSEIFAMTYNCRECKKTYSNNSNSYFNFINHCFNVWYTAFANYSFNVIISEFTAIKVKRFVNFFPTWKEAI